MQLEWIIKIGEHEASMEIDRDDLDRLSVMLAYLVAASWFNGEFEEWARTMLTKMATLSNELDAANERIGCNE